jgi:predicted aldo/keto reductase-like oxidoreductase
VVPIPGVQKIHEIEEIIQVVEGPRQMTEAEPEEMQQLKQKLGKTFCRRCDYCQPCTAGIPIALVLDTKSLIQKTSPTSIFSSPMAVELEKAANCTECGDCEERCPYHLPIRKLIAQNFRLYEKAKKKYLEHAASN